MFGRKRPADGTGITPDPEARRAEDALRMVRQMRHARAATPEWRELARRRRRRGTARAAGTVFLSLAGLVLLGGAVVGAREGFAWLRGHTDLFTVHRLAVTGTERLQPADILRAAGVAEGDDILALNADTLAARVARLPQVKLADARRTWKREVLFQVTERHPVANVLLDRLWQVDEEGVVLPGDTPDMVEDLPIIRGLGVSPVPPGTRLIAPGLDHALALVRNLELPEVRLDQTVSEVLAARPDSLVMTLLANGIPVRVGRGDIPPRRLMAFRAVLDDLAREKIEPEYLDLRFAGQVVVKPAPEKKEDEAQPAVEKKPAPPAAVGPAPARGQLKTPAAVGKKKHGSNGTGHPGAGARGKRSRHGRNA